MSRLNNKKAPSFLHIISSYNSQCILHTLCHNILTLDCNLRLFLFSLFRLEINVQLIQFEHFIKIEQKLLLTLILRINIKQQNK